MIKFVDKASSKLHEIFSKPKQKVAKLSEDQQTLVRDALGLCVLYLPLGNLPQVARVCKNWHRIVSNWLVIAKKINQSIEMEINCKQSLSSAMLKNLNIWIRCGKHPEDLKSLSQKDGEAPPDNEGWASFFLSLTLSGVEKETVHPASPLLRKKIIEYKATKITFHFTGPPYLTPEQKHIVLTTLRHLDKRKEFLKYIDRNL